MPLSKKHRKVSALVFGKLKGSVWGTQLHGEESSADMVTEKVKKVDKQAETLSLTQELIVPTVSTLVSDLNSKIQKVNARGNEDAETTKRALQKNETMTAELHYQSTETEKLLGQNRQLLERVKSLRSDLATQQQPVDSGAAV